MPHNQLCSAARFAALDFESAGAAPGETDVPVQIGIASFNITTTPELWDSYISTDKPIRWSAAKIHGITHEQIKDAPPYPSLWPVIREKLGGRVITGHNLGTEKRFLRAFPGHGFGPWIDTLTLSRACYPGLPDYSLESVCDALHLTPAISALLPHKNWHDALYDATASALLLQHIISALNMTDSPLYMLGNALK